MQGTRVLPWNHSCSPPSPPHQPHLKSACGVAGAQVEVRVAEPSRALGWGEALLFILGIHRGQHSSGILATPTSVWGLDEQDISTPVPQPGLGGFGPQGEDSQITQLCSATGI